MNTTTIIAAILAIIVIIAAVYLLAAPRPEPSYNASTAPSQAGSAQTGNSSTTHYNSTVNATGSVMPAANSSAPSGQGTATGAGNYSIGTGHNTTVGYPYLTNASGFALYVYAKDTPYGNSSACVGGCASIWPPFYVSTLSLPSSMNASDFEVINRTDGSRQLAYMGRPLYLYSHDAAPGQVNGQGLFNLWYAANIDGSNQTV